MVISRFFPEVGGAERQAHALARMLLARGHQVMVLTRQLGGLPKQEIVDGIPVIRAIRTVDLGPLFGLTYVISVARFLFAHRHDFDVIHVTHLYLDAFAAVLTRSLHGLPVVVRPACAGYYGDLARLRRFRVWPLLSGFDGLTISGVVRTIARADAFIGNSNELCEELIEAGFSAKRIMRIPNGVDLNHFSPDPAARSFEARRRLGLPPGLLMAFAGRLDPQKGLHALLEAVQPLLAGPQGARLLVMGDGPLRAELQLSARHVGLSDRILFLGLVKDVAPYLRACDIFVLPSVGEGMPNALLEAMATGLPCVASRIGGCIDIVTHGKDGLLVDPDNPVALREATCRLLASPELRARLGRAARESVGSRFSLERMTDQYEECFRSCRNGFRSR
ncbi:MAG: glycosyltransferase family 4 protein [candidate division NC10 bacterium]|nr:glycosyltransferase family 4 protein [candidate division NC10 bacterium]